MKFLNLLLEGKKEKLIDKYKDSPTFVDAPELLGKLIDGDPSATKKYSEWMIKQMIGLGDPSTYSIADNVNHFIDLIKKFHKSITSITPEDIDRAEGISSLVNADKVKSGPKDINKYDSIWGLQAVLSVVDRRQVEKEKESQVKGEAEKIYEDDRFLIVQPYSHGASCYYGAGTKWCTTSKDSSSYFDKYTSGGNLFYIIDKKSQNNVFGKMAIYLKNDGGYEVYDQQDAPRTIDIVYERFEPIKGVIQKLIKGVGHYEEFKSILEGNKDPERARIVSPILNNIVKDGDDYVVNIQFDNLDDFLNLFKEQVEEWELQFISNIIEPSYGYDFNFFDPYNWDEEVNEGYYLSYLTDEHLKVLKDILNVHDPKIAELIKETSEGYTFDREDMSTIGTFMNEVIDSKVMADLSYEYSNAYEQAVLEGMQKEIKSGLCNILGEIGINKNEMGNCFQSYQIKLKDLIDLYESDDSNSGMTLEGLIERMVESKIGFPYNEVHSLQYEVMDNETFTSLFNEPTLNILENAYEEFDDAEYIKDFEEYLRVLEELKKVFTIGKNTPVPTEENVFVEVEGVDYETNKVKFTLKRFNPETDSFEIKKGKSKLSSLISLMNNYQLFDPFV